jgi:hypothetical protein
MVLGLVDNEALTVDELRAIERKIETVEAEPAPEQRARKRERRP